MGKNNTSKKKETLTPQRIINQEALKSELAQHLQHVAITPDAQKFIDDFFKLE